MISGIVYIFKTIQFLQLLQNNPGIRLIKIGKSKYRHLCLRISSLYSLCRPCKEYGILGSIFLGAEIRLIPHFPHLHPILIPPYSRLDVLLPCLHRYLVIDKGIKITNISNIIGIAIT